MNDSDSSTNPPDDDQVSTKDYVNKLFDSSPEKPEEDIVEQYDPEQAKKTAKKKTTKKKPVKKKPKKKPVKKKQTKKKQKDDEAESKTSGGGGKKTVGDGWGVGTMVSAYWPGTDSYYDGEIMAVNDEKETCKVQFVDGDVNEECPWTKMHIL